jgi:hypothetical protein
MSNDAGSVNSQVIDATTGVVTLITGQAPSQAFGLLDAVMVETLGMAMHNAVSRQQGASVIGSAAVTAACAKMLTVPFPMPPPPPPPPPPTVQPLPGPPPTIPPSGVIAAAFSQAETAIDVLKMQAAGAGTLAQTAQADLGKLITEAGGTPQPAPPQPDPDHEIAAAFSQAETAIGTLNTQAADAAGLAQTARADLNKLITEAGGTPPVTPLNPNPGH